MESGRLLRNSQIIVLGISIALGTIISAYIFSQGLIKMKRFSSELISVTGSADKKITSDYIVWRLSFSRRDAQMTEAFKKLKEDLGNVKQYLISKGIAENEIIVSQISTESLYKKNEKGGETNEIEAYRLTQDLDCRGEGNVIIVGNDGDRQLNPVHRLSRILHVLVLERRQPGQVLADLFQGRLIHAVHLLHEPHPIN